MDFKFRKYDYELVHRKGTLYGNADSLSRIPYPYCKRTDCPDCKSRSSSYHAAAKTDKNDFISLISVASFQNDMKDDLPDCQASNWLDSWTHNDLVEMQRNDPILSKLITLKQTYDTKPGKEVVENCHLELSLLGICLFLIMNYLSTSSTHKTLFIYY